jgi:hypothetical protein
VTAICGLRLSKPNSKERENSDEKIGISSLDIVKYAQCPFITNIPWLTKDPNQAVTDTPCNVFAEELLAAYPEAKVVLSVRDNVDVWYASYLNAIQPFWNMMYLEPGLTGMIRRALSPRPRDDGMAWKLLQHTYYQDFPARGKQHYVDHNEKIRRLAREQKREFLEFNVKSGWEPLCSFLGDKQPDTPFPFGNDTKEMQGIVQGLKEEYDRAVRRNAMKILGVLSTAIAAYGIWYARK